MTPTPIYRDHTGQWREQNPFENMIMDERSTSGQAINPYWTQFEQSITYHPFPSAPDTKEGEVIMAYLQDQQRSKYEKHLLVNK